MKKYLLLFSLLTIFNFNCNTTEPPPPQKEQPKDVKLKLLDVSCTEAFINITASDTVLPINLTLNKDDKPLFNFTLTKTDTTIIDTTLLPGKTYVYQTTAIINGSVQKSDTIQVKSLDTTSHDFSWQTFTFGDANAGSSEINDVAMIDENNIWCVGEINVNDSSENGYTTYNAVHWDGSQWELKKISVIYNGNLITPHLYGIYAFSSTDIWLSSGVPVHGDGVNWTQYHLFDMGILGQNDGYLTKIWGTSSSNIYYVGTLGTIAHYQNGSWSKIESGTTSNVSEVWGDIEPVSKKLKILATVSAINDNKILSLTSSSANDTLNWPQDINLSGIWLDGRSTYAGGAEIWKNKNNTWHKETSTGYFFTRVRGTKCNNIYGIGPDGTVHFNGSSWQIIKPRPEGTIIVSGDCSNNMVVLAGFASSGGVVGKAVVMIGTQLK